MRVSFVYGLMVVGSIQLLMASSSFGQSPEQRVTKIKMEGESMKTLFTKLKTQAGLSFLVSGEVEEFNNISLPMAERSVKEVLDHVLSGTGLTYHIKGNIVFLYKRQETKIDTIENGGSVFKPDVFTITGKVIELSTQQPLPGVNILVKGTIRGTTSDPEGKYSIEVKEDETIVFSFIGFKTVETRAAGRTIINVDMEVQPSALKEVVINAGYYDVKDREKTGSIVKITGEQIHREPVSNPLAALQGKVAGLSIVQQSGVPGGNFRVRIRGQNSINNGNDPLYIIDGVPFTSVPQSNPGTASFIYLAGTNPLNAINPADIENIEVLKDADATAIYGSRGANGVILITTKKGQKGGTKVDFSYYAGAGEIASKVDLLNTEQYLEMRNEAFANSGSVPGSAPIDDDVNGNWGDINRYTDWQEVLIGGTSQTTDAQLSLSGGENNTVFSFGGNYHRETTVFPGDNAATMLSGRLNVQNTSRDQKLKTAVNVNYSHNFTDIIRKDLTRLVFSLPPNTPELYDQNGDLNWQNSRWINPLAYLKERFESNTNTLIAQLSLSYSITKNMDVKVSSGLTEMNSDAISLVPKEAQGPEPLPSSVAHYSNFSNSRFSNWTAEPQLNWRPQVGKLKMDFLLGMSLLSQKAHNRWESASGFASKSLMRDIRAATRYEVNSNTFSDYKYAALFGRLNLNLKDRYILNLTARRDGSSRFALENRFATFGAVGAAWIFSEESFINALTFLSFGKVRASYGITGNDQLPDYTYLDTYSSTDPYQGAPGLNPTRLSNDYFSWEKNKKFEVGLELGFLNDKISVEAGYYMNRASSQLVGIALPPTTGFSEIQANFPATIQNQGFEIEISASVPLAENLKWEASINATFPSNKLISFPGLDSFPAIYRDRFVIGKSLNIQKVYKYKGIDPVTGIYQFDDVNDDGIFNEEDRTTVVNKGRQDVFGGFQNSIIWKRFRLDILLQFVKQTGTSYISDYNGPGFMGNQPSVVMSRWQQEGDKTDIQKFSTDVDVALAHDRLRFSDQSVVNASFIRLKNISLAYTVPAVSVGKLRIRAMNLFIRGQNLLTITENIGADPEYQTGTKFLPPIRLVVAGINISL